MTSHLRLLCMVVRVMMVMKMVNGEEEEKAGVVLMNEAPPPSSPPPKTTPVEIASPPQLPLLQPTPPPLSPAPADPLPGLFVRQETAIRKVDGLIAKIGKLDDLDTKIDRLTSILQARRDQLEALVEEVAERVEEVEEKLSAVAGKIGELSEKVEVVFDVVTVLDGKVENLGGKVEEVDGRLVEMHEAVEEVRMEMNGTVEDRGEEKAEKETAQFITSTTATTSSTKSIPAPADLHLIMSNLTRRVEESLEENSASARECQEAVRHLEETLNPFINTSHHLAASVINRIRASNLAMDKRIGAVLHALSLRHHLLGDGLHKAISNLDSRLALLLQQHFNNVEDKVEEVEEVVRSSADELIVAFNSTSSTSSSVSTPPSTSSSSSSSISPLLLDTLDSILHLSNLTFHQLLQEKEEKEEEEQEEEEENVKVEEEEGEKKTPICAIMDENSNSTTSTTIPITSSTISNTTATTTTTTTTTTPPFTITATHLQDTVREALREKLTHLEEQVSGLRIYLSTSLHVHASQVEERVALVEAGLLRVVRETLSKSNRGLEKLRRASLGYLDAAVTSVSSAAVASAQATADHLSRTLTEVALMLARRMYQVEVAVRAAVGGGDGGGGGDGDDGGGGEKIGWQQWWWWWWCPAMVEKNGDGVGGVGADGGGACLSALPGNASGWGAARGRCRGVGGDLLTFAPTHTPLHPFLHPTQATTHSLHHSTPLPVPSFWVGGRRVLGEWRWVTGELVEEEVEEEGDGGGGDCLVMAVGEGGGVSMAASPCHTPRPALCQLSAPPGNDPGPPLEPHHNEVTNIATYHYLTPDDLHLA